MSTQQRPNLYVIFGITKDEGICIAGPFVNYSDAALWKSHYRWGSEIQEYVPVPAPSEDK